MEMLSSFFIYAKDLITILFLGFLGLSFSDGLKYLSKLLRHL